MRRLLALSTFAGFLFGGTEALAEAPVAPSACEAVQAELQATRRELGSRTSELERQSAATAAAEARAADLERTERALSDAQAKITSCQAEQRQLCSAADQFAEALTTGQVGPGLDACVAPDTRHTLVEQLSGWSHASAVLSELAAYSSGDTDTVPRPRLGAGTKIERLIARLLTQHGGPPLVFRRLLVEALTLMAPRAWSAVRGGSPGVDRWFASSEPLEPALVAEAHAGLAQSTDKGSASLSSALQLVGAYERLAGCGGPRAPKDCVRAAELRQLLETSGPLVARRVVQDVWRAECSTLNESVVSDWIRALSFAQLSSAQLDDVIRGIHGKLFTCFMRDSTAGWSLPAWLGTKLPHPKTVTARALPVLRAIETAWESGSRVDACAHAARALQTLEAPAACAGSAALREHVAPYATGRAASTPEGFEQLACDRLVRSLWAGEPALIPDRFETIPSVEDLVHVPKERPSTNVRKLRDACEQRMGQGRDFEDALRELSAIAAGFGEDSGVKPWNRDARTGRPLEAVRAERAFTSRAWLSSFAHDDAECSAIGVGANRCRACKGLSAARYFDCSLLASVRTSWRERSQRALETAAALLGSLLVIAWAFRVHRALRAHGAWLEQVASHLTALELVPQPDRLRYLLPARMERLRLRLPRTPAWERWGAVAVVVHGQGTTLTDRDVNRAAAAAHAAGAELAFLVHDDGVSPEMGAIRAMLEWAARGARRGAQVLPLAVSRLEWAKRPGDLLELAEDASLRNNPFEVRGRITSSTQFFDRERLISGLLASVQAGRFIVVTGLRRFGKSSLTLEVARRLPGPAAFVDLAGFHHEIRFLRDPAAAVDKILHFVCLKLLESAESRYGGRLRPLALPSGSIDAAALSLWLRAFFARIAEAGSGKPPPVLVILDEIEQAIGAAEELDHALDVFAILVGRVRNALPGTSDDPGARVGILFASALHPLLWSPLGTLAHQSLIGSYEYVAVPTLPEDAAAAMMRGLGSLHGVRFTDAALARLVEESQGVPLLLRRLGAAVLELYDPERARQGALGAVEIGVEGVRAALEREESPGSPLRVWVESEIADAVSPGGSVLRHLATRGRASVAELRSVAGRAFAAQFESTGMSSALSAGESVRRAQEAAAVVVRILGDSGLLVALGDTSDPEGYELPEGVLRRVLSGTTETTEQAMRPAHRARLDSSPA